MTDTAEPKTQKREFAIIEKAKERVALARKVTNALSVTNLLSDAEIAAVLREIADSLTGLDAT